MHEDNAPVTTVSFSPNGKYILAFTLDSCVRLWDYVSGTCKKTYQGHVNTKYSIGGAFGYSREGGFIVSGSEIGEILFWDFRSKEIAQRVMGHDGVVCWVDTSPGPYALVASGGMDGTVRIWIEDDDGIAGLDGLKSEHENGNGEFGDDGEQTQLSPERDLAHSVNGHQSPNAMEED